MIPCAYRVMLTLSGVDGIFRERYTSYPFKVSPFFDNNYIGIVLDRIKCPIVSAVSCHLFSFLPPRVLTQVRKSAILKRIKRGCAYALQRACN